MPRLASCLITTASQSLGDPM